MALTFDALARDSGFLSSKSGLGSSDMVVDKPVGTSRGEQASASKPGSQKPQSSSIQATRRQKSTTEEVPEPESLSPAKRAPPTVVPRAASAPIDTPSRRPAHRVRFAEGPLREVLGRAGAEVTEDGHPNHEGQVAERRRELHAVFSEEAVTKHSMRLMEVILGEENSASVQRLKRRFGLCPPAPRHLPYVTHPEPVKACAKPPLPLPGDAKVPIMAKVPRIVLNGSNSPNRSAGLRAARALDTKAASGSSEKGKAASASEKPSQQGNPLSGVTKPQGSACLRRPVMRKPKRLQQAGADSSSVRDAQEVPSSGVDSGARISGSVPEQATEPAGLASGCRPACSGGAAGGRVTRSQSLKASASLQGGEEVQSGDRSAQGRSGGWAARSQSLRGVVSSQGGEEVQSRGEPAQQCDQVGLREEMQGILKGLLGPEGALDCGGGGGQGVEDTSKRKAEVDVGDLRKTASC